MCERERKGREKEIEIEREIGREREGGRERERVREREMERERESFVILFSVFTLLNGKLERFLLADISTICKLVISYVSTSLMTKL